jgi:hypothetical protein
VSAAEDGDQLVLDIGHIQFVALTAEKVEEVRISKHQIRGQAIFIA